MANHKSAIKRARQNEGRRLRNRSVKTRVKGVVKKVNLAVDENAVDSAAALINTAKSEIDKAAKKGVLHKNTAARKISRLSKKVNMFKYYREQGIINSVESALFGSVWTNILNTIVDVKTRAKQEIRNSEMDEFKRIMASRAREIKSKITEIANR